MLIKLQNKLPCTESCWDAHLSVSFILNFFFTLDLLVSLFVKEYGAKLVSQWCRERDCQEREDHGATKEYRYCSGVSGVSGLGQDMEYRQVITGWVS